MLLETKTGQAVAWASITTRPRPSDLDGRMNKLALEYFCTNSSISMNGLKKIFSLCWELDIDSFN